MKRVFKILIGIVAVFFLVAVIGIIGQSIEDKKATKEKTEDEQPTEKTVTDVTDNEPTESDVTSTTAEQDQKAEAEANATKYPATPGKKLFGEEFKGMEYHFKGELVKTESVEGLFGEMKNALLVKNENGYVLVIFPPYEVEANVGDEIEAWGPLSGDGYASSDLGIENVVGVTGAMNASQINVNGEQR